jgi:hypothetical protein
MISSYGCRVLERDRGRTMSSPRFDTPLSRLVEPETSRSRSDRSPSIRHVLSALANGTVHCRDF